MSPTLRALLLEKIEIELFWLYLACVRQAVLRKRSLIFLEAQRRVTKREGEMVVGHC